MLEGAKQMQRIHGNTQLMLQFAIDEIQNKLGVRESERNILRLPLVVIESEARRIVFAAHIDQYIAIGQQFRITSSNNLRTGKSRKLFQNEARQSFVTVEFSVVRAYRECASTGSYLRCVRHSGR